MKLLALGATGGTGREVVAAALAAGWEVTAFVRDPGRLSVRHDRLRVVRGEVTDGEALRAALEGQDAVISTLGQQRGTPADLMRRAMDALLPAMAAAGVRRLVVLSGSGVKFPGDGPPPLFERLAVPLIRLVLPRLLDDTRGYADRVVASDRDWVLARPMRLTDGPGGRPVRAADTLDYGVSDAIDRKDLAAFLVAQLDAPTWVRKTPMVTAG